MRKSRTLVLCSLIAFALSSLTLSSCWEEQHPGTYYTFTGQTIGSALAAKPEYSDFVRILEKAGLNVTLRTRRGRKIGGACGQLGKVKNGN